MARLIDAENYRNLFNEEFKKTMELIRKGETHLDTLAEGFTEADRVIRALPTIDPVYENARIIGSTRIALNLLMVADGRRIYMERYTYFDGGKWRMRVGDAEYSGKETDRLAAYEDMGLKPEDMKRAFNEDTVLKLAGQALGMSPDRLRELAYAEKDGRLVVLPRLHGKKVEVFSIREAAEAALEEMGVSNDSTNLFYR